MRLIETDAITNVNISGATAVAQYTADDAREMFASVLLRGIAANGDYTVYLSREVSSVEYHLRPRTTDTVETGTTNIELITIPVPVKSGDLLRVYVDGLAGDTAINGEARWFEADYLRPTTAGQHDVAVDASGQVTVGAMAAGVIAAASIANDAFTDAKFATGAFAKVWTSATRTLTSFGTLVTDVWAHLMTSITADDGSIGGFIEARLDAAVSSILASVASSFARVTGVLRASSVSVVQGDTIAEPLTLTPFVWATGDVLIVTLKETLSYKSSKSDAADAILQWRFTNGGTNVLSYIKKAAAGASASKGTLTVTDDDNGVITVNLDEDVSLLIQGEYTFDVKHLVSATDAINTLGGGKWTFEPTVTYSVS